MQIARVNNRQRLIKYLEALPEDARSVTSRWIAVRSAARVLPRAVRYLAENNEIPHPTMTASPVFSALAASWITAEGHQPPPRFGVHADSADVSIKYARTITGRAMNAARTSAPPSGDFAAIARPASGATYAVDAILASYSTKSTIVTAASAVSHASKAARKSGAIWHAVNVDLAVEAQNQAQFSGPIWRDVPCPEIIEDDWAIARKLLSQDSTTDWSFWIAWYERVLAGRDTLPADMAKVLNAIGADDWEKGPAHVNPMFDGVLGLYRAQDFQNAHPYGFRAQIDSRKDRLDLVAVTPVDLTDIVQKLRAALSDFKRRSLRDVKGNQLVALCYELLLADIEDLRKVISRYKDNPQALHDEIVRYEKHIIRKLQDQGLPQAAEVASLLDDMLTVQSEICLMSEDVRQKEALRTELARERSTEAQKLQAIRNCLGMLSDGTSEMEVFAKLAVQALVDPDASKPEKQMAWQFAFRLAANAATTIKAHEQEVGKENTNLGKRLKDISDFAVAGDKFVDAIQEAMAEGAPWVEGFLNHVGANGFPANMT